MSLPRDFVSVGYCFFLPFHTKSSFVSQQEQFHLSSLLSERAEVELGMGANIVQEMATIQQKQKG